MSGFCLFYESELPARAGTFPHAATARNQQRVKDSAQRNVQPRRQAGAVLDALRRAVHSPRDVPVAELFGSRGKKLKPKTGVKGQTTAGVSERLDFSGEYVFCCWPKSREAATSRHMARGGLVISVRFLCGR
jgi:hypothetical protein